jgi:hypothetical protein
MANKIEFIGEVFTNVMQNLLLMEQTYLHHGVEDTEQDKTLSKVIQNL